MATRENFIFLVLFSFISPCLMATGRKYDVETEAMKLYGEDFKSVLRRFRKTPDYLKILTDRMQDLNSHVIEMSLQILHYYHGKMTERVHDIIGVSKNLADGSTTPSPMLYYHAYGNRRQEDQNQDDTSKIGIKILDSYKMFSHPLTVQERNSFKDLGFEFAGNIIHSLIQNMGPVEGPVRSTRQPFGGGDAGKNVLITTEHPRNHEVTVDTPVNRAKTTPEGKTPDTFRFRRRDAMWTVDTNKFRFTIKPVVLGEIMLKIREKKLV